MAQQTAEQLSENPAFADGDGPQHATCASWERGVGATHASGTGGAAVFVASGTTGPFYVSSTGGTLSFRYDENGAVIMTGPANYE